MYKFRSKYIAFVTILLIASLGIIGYEVLISDSEQAPPQNVPAEGVQYISKTDRQSFYVLRDNQWTKMFVKGVNLGAGKPGAFPGEVAITYDEYYRWFGYISAMNANTIRVYTTQRPQFYNALSDFNKMAEQEGRNPLYVIHGVWVNEEDVATIGDAFGSNNQILNEVVKSGEEIVDIIHGSSYLPVRKGYADGTYTSDVSKYVVGWILGIEWDPAFVIGTNENNPGRGQYAGKFMYTEGASPFEAFLAELGDRIASYENDKYSMQRPIAFSNWVTTDPLKHPNEPYENEDIVSVNVEHVKARASYKPGMFASYHVYPYYPDSLSLQTDYVNYKGADGKPDPYMAYLEDIKKVHTMPIIVSEFGIPASRGKAHENRVTGFNQGNIDEKTQGEMLVHMINDIHAANLAGGLIFTWQDEWFKRTWNTSDLDVPDSRPYWSNPQTNEQHFGLLAFDAGSTSLVNVDGKPDEWNGDAPLLESGGAKLYAKSDEAYVYLRIDAANYDFEKDTLLLPIDTIDGQGNAGYSKYGATFSRPADFAIAIHGEADSHMLVDAYYDNYYFRYAVQNGLIEKNPAYEKKNSGVFNPIRLALIKGMKIPGTGERIPFTGYETGRLHYGNANPDSPAYDSLSDFYYVNGHLEIRLPWQLFNVMDPSKKLVMGDMYTLGKISPVKAERFNIGVQVIKAGGAAPVRNMPMAAFSWSEWSEPTSHERLKPSYYIVQQGFHDLEAGQRE